MEYTNPSGIGPTVENECMWLPCDCHTEGITVEYDAEVDEFYMAVYHLVNFNQMSLWQRLRYCWRILRSGRPYGDQISISRGNAVKLTEFINYQINKKALSDAFSKRD